MKRFKFKYLIFIVFVFFVLKLFGVFTHLFEKDFYNDFHYPYDGDIQEFIEQLRHNQTPTVLPINEYNFNYLINNKNKCKDSYGNNSELRLVYLIKTAMNHFDRRLAIRNSWGFEKRFSDVPIRRIFILGINSDQKLMNQIKMESEKYGDIIQANFFDTYYNNTYKTMMGFKWAVTYCPNARFYMIVDDDIYVSTKNVLRFLRNPTNYPSYLMEPVYNIKSRQQILNKNKINKREITSITTIQNGHPSQFNTNFETTQNVSHNVTKKALKHLTKRQIIDFELPSDVQLYSGQVFISSPHRHISSKWYITLDEYPYHMWPPYVSAGSYVVSKETLHDLYYASFYTKHFIFDDIYLGIIAMKMNIEPYHCPEFYLYKKPNSIDGYKYVITSHGYDDPEELLRVWNEQKSVGNA